MPGRHQRRRALLAMVSSVVLALVAGCAQLPASELGRASAQGVDPPGTVRYFGPDAPWNLTAAQVGRSLRYAGYADRFWRAADLRGRDDPSFRGQVDVLFGDYSVPIYDRREATTEVRVFRTFWGWPGTIPTGGTIPWNPSWQPAGGTDATLLVVDPSTGSDIELWAIQRGNWSSCLTPENLLAGYVPDQDLCVGTANLITHADSRPVDVRRERGRTPVRGMGVEKLALLTRADEVASGRIDHALEMTVGNTMFGPACPGGPDDPGAGVTCGFFLPPATKVEHAEGPAAVCSTEPGADEPAARTDTVPSGMRFALAMTDREIDAWLAGRQLAEPLRSTARIFAVALRDYGWMVAETSCAGASIETDGLTNPVTAATWARLGVTSPEVGATLLDGLFTRDRIVVLNPSDR